ncbi:UPF0598 protein CG30010-like [Styela clava]|uniref:UPF0598 protein CG30010-like n=1 Tax=Styela clava TaxID=7725 RepID=UPI001939AB4B|nr:UPF0598 protein CG30010-like [Styela clava]
MVSCLTNYSSQCFKNLIRKLTVIGAIRCNYSSNAAANKAYTQGQYAEKNIREYFYYIDHQGQLFLDDTKVKNFITCFKDKPFLEFFFRRIKGNVTGRYQDSFPYLSLCGRERNFIRCDDYPIVYTHIIEKTELDSGGVQYLLSYGGAGDKLTLPFEPTTLCMLPHTGRVYHICHDRYGGIGLIKSSLAIDISSGFVFDDSVKITSLSDGQTVELPSKFVWKGVTYDLTNELCDKVIY